MPIYQIVLVVHNLSAWLNIRSKKSIAVLSLFLPNFKHLYSFVHRKSVKFLLGTKVLKKKYVRLYEFTKLLSLTE